MKKEDNNKERIHEEQHEEQLKASLGDEFAKIFSKNGNELNASADQLFKKKPKPGEE